jgi:hypothetical protein
VPPTGPEGIARIGIAAWVGESDDCWDPPPVLGVVGDLYLVEIDAGTRERILVELVDSYQVDERGLGLEIAFFGDAGGFFASSLSFLEHWPKSLADMPADVFIDHHHRAALTRTEAGDEVAISVRHALRPSNGPPKRRFCFRSNEYEAAMSVLARESRRLRDDLMAVAQQRAPEKIDSLREAFEGWPA